MLYGTSRQFTISAHGDWTADIDEALLFDGPVSAVTALARRVLTESREWQERFVFSVVGIEEYSNAVPTAVEDLAVVRSQAEVDHLRSISRLNNSLAALNESEARKLNTERRQNDV